MTVHTKPTIDWVVTRYQLRPNRGGFIPCPIHEEREPSCHLDRRKDFWYCFGCGANGDSLGLIAAITKAPIGDVLRAFAEHVPSWRAHRTLTQVPRGTTVRRTYRELHSWMFHELARRLEGAPEWLLLRCADYWGERFDLIHEVIEVDDDLPRAEEMLKGLAAQCERGLDCESKLFWTVMEGTLALREGVE